MDAMQFLRGVENPMRAYTLPHLGRYGESYEADVAAGIVPFGFTREQWEEKRDLFAAFYAYEEAKRAEQERADYYAAQGLLTPEAQAAVDRAQAELDAKSIEQAEAEALAYVARVQAQEAARLAAEQADELALQAAIQARSEALAAQQEAQRIEAERIAYAQMLADIERQGREEQARIDAYIAQTQAEVVAFDANFQAMLAEQARLEAERQAALKAEQQAAERAQFEADNAQRLALAAELQRIAESGSVPVEAMIATGQFTQAQLDTAAEVQAGQLAAQQEATRLDLASQDAEQRAKVNVELAAQAQAEAQAIAEEQAAIDADIQAYIAQDQAARSAELAFLTVAEDVSRGIDATAVVTAPPAPSDAVLTEPEIIYDIPFPDVSIREVPETTPPVETPAPATGVTAMEQYVFGDITLPQGWYQFTPAQKATWFNQNNVTPTRLRAAGVPDQDIIYLRQAGYTIQDATTTPPVSPVAPAAGNLLPLALAAAFVLFGG